MSGPDARLSRVTIGKMCHRRVAQLVLGACVRNLEHVPHNLDVLYTEGRVSWSPVDSTISAGSNIATLYSVSIATL